MSNGKAIHATNATQVEGNPPDLWADELIMKQMGGKNMATPSEMESLNKSESKSSFTALFLICYACFVKLQF